jgi:hypothetical protein
MSRSSKPIKIPHVIMFRQVGPDYQIQAVCTCNWEGTVHSRFSDAEAEGDRHQKRYEGFPRPVTPD